MFYQHRTLGGLYLAILSANGDLSRLFKWDERKRTFKKVLFDLRWRDPVSYFRAEFFPHNEATDFYAYPVTKAIARKARRKIATK